MPYKKLTSQIEHFLSNKSKTKENVTALMLIHVVFLIIAENQC